MTERKKYFNYDNEQEKKQKNPEHFDKMLPWKSLDDLKGEHFASLSDIDLSIEKECFFTDWLSVENEI